MTLTVSPLYILFLAEIIFLIIVFAILMAVSRRKYKRLYKSLLSKSESPSTASIAAMQAQKTEDYDNQAEDIPSQDISIDKTIPAADIKENAQEEEKPVEEESSPIVADTAEIEGEEGSLPGEDETATGVKKLKKIVDFQKEKIVNLMCYKDILESAQKKLVNIHTDYQDLTQRFSSISEAIGTNKEFELALDMFGDNTNELKDFIDALQHENDTLLEKFNAWEGQLKDLWQESEDVGAGAENMEAVLAENNEMIEKIREFEEKFKEKSKQLEEAQAQYEDLEKEYMTLYRQQQAAQQAK